MTFRSDIDPGQGRVILTGDELTIVNGAGELVTLPSAEITSLTAALVKVQRQRLDASFEPAVDELVAEPAR